VCSSDLYDWKREYDDYSKDSVGGALRFGYPIWERWQVSSSYRFDDTTLSDLEDITASVIRDSRDINVTSSVTLGLRRDTRNRLYDPTEGSDYSLNIEYAGGPLGGDSAFTKAELSAGKYYPFFLDTTLHLRGVMGQVMENSGGMLPVYERFYLGGINTLRGFKTRRVSPRVRVYKYTNLPPLVENRVGGEKMWYTNLEWIFPLVKDAGLKGVVFLDAGNVYDGCNDLAPNEECIQAGDSWDIGNLKKSLGLGFRWLSPMGPLRLEWGYNLDPVGNEDSSNWDFAIGGAF